MKKTELAIATDFAGESTELEQIRDMLVSVAKAGFTHIHWCHEWDGDYIYSSYEMQQIREWMDQYGLKAKALHATKGSRRNVNIRREHYRKDYTSDWEYNRKAGVELIKNRVDLAECLGAGEIVLHLYVPHFTIRENPGAKENFYACVCKSMDELMPYCTQKGVRICLENLFDMPGEYVMETWDRLFAKYPPEFLGICLDSGHANMIWGNEMTEVIRKYGDRLYAVHLHDNYGAADFHMIPGEGRIDWKSVMTALAQSAYEGPLVMELSCEEKDTSLFLQKAYEAGLRLDRLYQDAKNSLFSYYT